MEEGPPERIPTSSVTHDDIQKLIRSGRKFVLTDDEVVGDEQPQDEEPVKPSRSRKYQAISCLVYLPVDTSRWQEAVSTFKPKSQEAGNVSVQLAGVHSDGLWLRVLYANQVKVEPDDIARVARKVTTALGGDADQAQLHDVQRVGLGHT